MPLTPLIPSSLAAIPHILQGRAGNINNDGIFHLAQTGPSLRLFIYTDVLQADGNQNPPSHSTMRAAGCPPGQ